MMVKLKQCGLWLCVLALGFLVLNFGVNVDGAIAVPTHPTSEIFIEWLQFEVPAAEQALFIEKEYEIWEPIDRRSPDYLGKEMWRDAQDPNQLIMVNRWSSAAHHQGITKEMVQQAEQDFTAAVGEDYPIVAAKKFRLQP